MRYLLIFLILLGQVNAEVINRRCPDSDICLSHFDISQDIIDSLCLGDKIIVDKDYETVSLEYHNACMQEFQDKLELYIAALEVITEKVAITNANLKEAQKSIKRLSKRIKKNIINHKGNRK